MKRIRPCEAYISLSPPAGRRRALVLRGRSEPKPIANADRFAFDLTVSGALYGECTVPRLRADGMVSAHNSCLRSSK